MKFAVRMVCHSMRVITLFMEYDTLGTHCRHGFSCTNTTTLMVLSDPEFAMFDSSLLAFRYSIGLYRPLGRSKQEEGAECWQWHGRCGQTH